MAAGDVICGECPKVYPSKEIAAYEGDRRVTTLADLQPGDGAGKGGAGFGKRASRAFFGIRTATGPVGPDLEDGLRRLRDYTFYCPQGHRVDGNAGEQFPLAMLGASGASKSHMLPAIVHELDDKRALSSLGITLTEALYGDPKLALDVRDLYRNGLRLRRTDPGTLLGPFGYKLKVRAPDGGRDHKLSLILFDVAGEDLQGIVKIADKARFILLCRALMILIDPQDFLPTQFESGIAANERAQIHAARDVRSGIRVIAETLAEVWNVDSSRQLPIPVCFVLAKADSIEWRSGFDWKTQTDDVIAAGAGEDDLAAALQESSDATRAAFQACGGQLVLEEIEDLFDARWVRYAPASATSTMPKDEPDPSGREWEDYPDPNGSALALLQLLALAQVLRPRAAAVR